jgi:hypothetical protein
VFEAVLGLWRRVIGRMYNDFDNMGCGDDPGL